jgi:metallothionein
MPTTTEKTCAHQGCGCTVDAGKGVEKNGKSYCSQGCADGKGCDHPGCTCSGS